MRKYLHRAVSKSSKVPSLEYSRMAMLITVGVLLPTPFDIQLRTKTALIDGDVLRSLELRRTHLPWIL
jgi:hypothetical protein